MTTIPLDATRLLLVPVLFNRGDDRWAVRLTGGVHRHAVQAFQIGGHPLKQAFGNPLPVLWFLQELFVRGVTQERYLRQDRWHIRPNQHYKRSLAHATVLHRSGSLL